MTQFYTIQTQPSSAAQKIVRLAAALESVLPLVFSRTGQSTPTADGQLVFTTPDKDHVVKALRREPEQEGLPELQTSLCPGDWEGKLIETKVNFMDHERVPFPFRGKTLCVKLRHSPRKLVLREQEIVLARSESGPIWTVLEQDKANSYQSAFPVPELDASGILKDVLNEDVFVEVLPLLHWLRELCVQSRPAPLPLRAVFIFDDPNLHWGSYGHVNFTEVARHAEEHNYHVSFATIPLDTWFTHGGTAELFRNWSSRLSLCVHGNDHIKRELARNYSQETRHHLLNQAIERVERLERASGLKVCRVMVPPHGACSEEMLQAMPACGFEAACISHGSLYAHNRTKLWTKYIGLLSSECVAGCLVLPRWSLAGNIENTILLAAYLNQPVILRGHHQDLKDGIERLDHLAGLINSLGCVSWMRVSQLGQMEQQRKRCTRNCLAKQCEVAAVAKPGAGSMPPLGAIIRRILTEGRDRLRI